MINYIESNLSEELSLEAIAEQAGYSPFYCSRAFQREARIRLKDYIRLRRLTLAALDLRDTDKKIIDIAVEYGYGSQEAFSRAFQETFLVTPAAYRNKPSVMPLFVRLNIEPHHHQIMKGEDKMKKYQEGVRISYERLPERRMWAYFHEGAENYHDLCDTEDAHQIWGILESIKDSLGGIIAGWVEHKGVTRYVWAVEFPIENDTKIPDELVEIKLPAGEFVKFNHPPYPEAEHEAVTEAVWNVCEQWNPQQNGYKIINNALPTYENDNEVQGYLVMKPVERI
jgi:AraC-like DNA-binding protein/predicted transcriptional regulator YdeE